MVVSDRGIHTFSFVAGGATLGALGFLDFFLLRLVDLRELADELLLLIDLTLD